MRRQLFDYLVQGLVPEGAVSVGLIEKIIECKKIFKYYHFKTKSYIGGLGKMKQNIRVFESL